MPKVIKISDKNWKNLKYITFGLAYATFSFFLLLNGKDILGYWDDAWTWQISVYIFGVAIFLAVLKKLPEDLTDTTKPGKSFQDNIAGFLISFTGFMALFILVKHGGLWFQGSSYLPAYMIVSHWIFHIGIVATSEEIIFRGVLFHVLYKVHPLVGYLGSSFIFAVFHYSAYGGSVDTMLIAFTMGLILALLTRYLNLGFAIGFHGAYNCMMITTAYLMIKIIGG